MALCACRSSTLAAQDGKEAVSQLLYASFEPEDSLPKNGKLTYVGEVFSQTPGWLSGYQEHCNYVFLCCKSTALLFKLFPASQPSKSSGFQYLLELKRILKFSLQRCAFFYLPLHRFWYSHLQVLSFHS